ncbi:DNA polymerase III subunit [Candidatus Acetothermia bacterium]|nr:DNA polymerase III subunit [Candidatus Acetothermia bacterium]MBI3643907.1 DNA polymerase III subunit [Candidatus Acetothermia bacterium]
MTKILQALWGEALQQEKIAHAYLLVGTGTEPLIHEFVVNLFCEKDGCGECGPCLKILNGTHPDIKRVEKDGKRIKIDQIRELQLDSRYPPLEAPRKVYILKSVEDLSTEAANSLLKILESPPSYVLFLLTAESTNLLPTILSRCQTLRLSPTSPDLQKKALIERGLSEEEVEAALSIVAGIPQRFERLTPTLQEGASILEAQRSAGTQLQEKSMPELVALLAESESLIAEREVALQLLWSLREKGAFEILEAAQAISKLPIGKSDCFIEEALRWHRDLLLMMQSEEPNGMIFNQDHITELETQAAQSDPQKILRVFYQLERGHEVFQGNANLQLYFESLFLRLAE